MTDFKESFWRQYFNMFYRNKFQGNHVAQNRLWKCCNRNTSLDPIMSILSLGSIRECKNIHCFKALGRLYQISFRKFIYCFIFTSLFSHQQWTSQDLARHNSISVQKCDIDVCLFQPDSKFSNPLFLSAFPWRAAV